ncbi:MAG: response regulator transcription factor [Candidatus Melainabacteria bacterium]|nr:response regulator transcription factor [Candidatus Melainabacteria bacterium]MBI3307855.1 response regulator transcription factor [Candidatus Melainabacteria bacterium]
MPNKILLVDDEVNLIDPVAYNLKQKGYDTITTYDGKTALESFRRDQPDLVLLDWTLPDVSGVEILKQIRAEQDYTPIIMLTGRTAKEDIVEGLTAGADDYVTKPFTWEELLARISSVLRRAQQVSQTPGKRLRFGDLIMDTASHRVWLADKELSLSPREYALLEIFMNNPRRVYSRDDLIERVWGLDYDGDTKTVDVHICWLRQKIEEDPARPKVLQTVRGFGYRLGG